MSFVNYFKEISISWKFSLFLVVFCIWPISSYLIFNFHLQLFVGLDLLKLTLLSSAIASPFLVVNTSLTFLLSNPKDDDLKWGNTHEQLLSGTVFIGVVMTLIILSFGAAAAIIGSSILVVKLVLAGFELVFLFTILISKVIEDKRFKHKERENLADPIN